MSADLFAQFGPASGGSQPARAPSAQAPSSSQAEDPFAFLSTAFSQASVQPAPAAAQQPKPLPQLQTQALPFPTLPIQSSGPSGSGSWSSTAWTLPATTPAPPPAAGNQADDDDGWGDFEVASPITAAPPIAPPILPSFLPTPAQPQPQQLARTRVLRSSTIDLMSNTLIHLDEGPLQTQPSAARPSPQPAWQSARQPVQPKKSANPSVLFDADDPGSSDDDDDDDGNFDDDDFGAFESANAGSLPPKPAAPKPMVVKPPPPRATAARPAPILVDLLSLSDPEPTPTPSIATPKATISTKKQQPPAQLLSVLTFGGTTAPAASSNYPQPPKSPSFRERNPFPGLAVTTPNVAEFPAEQVANRTPSPVTVWPSFEPSSAAPSGTSKTAKTIGTAKTSANRAKGMKVSASAAAEPTDDWDAWDLADTPATPEPDTPAVPAMPDLPTAPASLPDSAPPPTNVPPPSVLLSAFPALLALPDETLLQPIAGQPADVRARILGDPRTVAFLRNYLQLVVVAARIVAGRKQRWHRDRFLSQSMSISAAGSSRGGGMKLAGVDRAQGQREDREAADVLAAWHRHVGKIRSAVATANTAIAARVAAEHRHQPPLPPIPDLPAAAVGARASSAATIPITTAKNVPTATRPCVICGLRRDERVRGVDGDDVQDSFGEWWVEHWGHRACRNFWAEHEVALRSR